MGVLLHFASIGVEYEVVIDELRLVASHLLGSFLLEEVHCPASWEGLRKYERLGHKKGLVQKVAVDQIGGRGY
jgi:hypothetical protein